MLVIPKKAGTARIDLKVNAGAMTGSLKMLVIVRATHFGTV